MISPIRIDQFLAGFSPYDAISNEALIMQDILRTSGFISEIFAEHLHPAAGSRAKYHHEYRPSGNTRDVAIYHFSIGSAVTTFLAYQPVRLIVRYHNVTPPEFFTLKSDGYAYHAALLGKKQIPVLNQLAEGILADSEYNLRDFKAASGKYREVIPILRDYRKLTTLAEDPQLKRYFDESKRKHWLFVGRIAPNKGQHNLIETLKIYKEVIDPGVTLILVGSFFSQDYKDMIMDLCKSLGLNTATGLDAADEATDVLFLPSVSDESLVTSYKRSDLFLCLSDHEGFCVPLIEAMSAGLKVVALHSSAVTETAKNAVMIPSKSPVDIIEAIEKAKTGTVSPDEKADFSENVQKFRNAISAIVNMPVTG